MSSSSNSESSINTIIDDARNSLSSYCSTICKAYCCRNGVLPIGEKEHKKFFLAKAKEKDIVSTPTGMFGLKLTKKGCPFMDKKYQCSIYKNKMRPVMCHDYPIFLRYQTIQISTVCPGTKEEFFMKHVDKLEKEFELRITKI